MAATPAGDDGTERAAALGLAAGRLAIGIGIWAAPRLAARALGFGLADGEARALARLAGTRDIALGALALEAAADPARRRRTALLNALVDAGDALTFAAALIARDGIDRAALVGVAAAGTATAAGVWVASGE
jgi:hypothetical protein